MTKKLDLRDPRDIWDEAFASHDSLGLGLRYEPWLERWLPLLERGRSKLILDLGCGSGHDSRYLTALGFRVACADHARQALSLTQQIAPKAMPVQVDLRDGLPFGVGAFGAIVANLCLHYFSWARTLAILGELRRCLRPGGFVLARVNAARGYRGAGVNERIDEDFYIVGGLTRRYFTESAVRQAFGRGWRIQSLQELTIGCYGSPKVVWEVIAEKG